jgi:hypothetical protein
MQSSQSSKVVTKLHKISTNMINNKENIISTQQFKSTYALQNNKFNMNIHVSTL